MAASLWKCPVCGSALRDEAQAMVCVQGHNFDKAASGYVNLMPSGGKRGKLHGDSPEMVAARRRFLQTGAFSCLRAALAEEAARLAGCDSVFVDAGCGEGYYTQGLQGRFSQVIGVDVSKDAVRRAAKAAKNNRYCVASIFHLPFFDESVDLLTSVFAPYSAEEFRRVLVPQGFVLAVVPGRSHLWELKEFLYDKPYPNDEAGYVLPGFAYRGTRRVEERVVIEGSEPVQNLFQMTPYFWKTPRQAAEKLRGATRLETTVSFLIYQYQKTEGANEDGK